MHGECLSQNALRVVKPKCVENDSLLVKASMRLGDCVKWVSLLVFKLAAHPIPDSCSCSRGRCCFVRRRRGGEASRTGRRRYA
eukprot:3025905-Pleurochrysis_carterae.AAC.2